MAKRTHCDHGHEIVEVVIDKYGTTRRFCRTCKRVKQQQWWRELGRPAKEVRNANAKRAREEIKASLPPREPWQGRKNFCIHGHRLTVKTTRVYLRWRGDKRVIQRQCRMCLSEYDRRRYHTNPERRARVLRNVVISNEKRKLKHVQSVDSLQG